MLQGSSENRNNNASFLGVKPDAEYGMITKDKSLRGSTESKVSVYPRFRSIASHVGVTASLAERGCS